MKGTFSIDGKECEIVHVFTNNNNNYIIYTDGTMTDNNKLELFANKFEINKDDNITLLPINDDEWDIIDKEWRIENE